MKRLKKLKVLVSLLAMFSLFSLTNVNATEGKDKNLNKHVSEIKEEKEQENEKDNLKKEETNNKEKDNNINLNEEEDEICTSKSLPYVKRNEEQKGNQEYNEMGIPEKEQELEDLSKKFLSDCVDFNFHGMFENIMNCLGNFSHCIEFNKSFYLKYKNYLEKNYLYKGVPKIHISPWRYLYVNSKNSEGKDNVEKILSRAKYDYSYPGCNKYNNFSNKIEVNGEDADLFSDFEQKRFYFGQFFLPGWSIDFFRHYCDCFEENMIYPIDYIGESGELKYRVPTEVLKHCLSTAVDVNEDFKLVFEEFVKFFVKEMFLKLLFMAHYRDKYNFSDPYVLENVKKFSSIMSKALKLHFNKSGLLDSFKLDFSSSDLNEEDRKFLKRLCDVIDEGGDNLFYDLYLAMFAFLKNKEFWNKMFGTIVFINALNTNNTLFRNFYNANCNSIDKVFQKYFNSYVEVYERISNEGYIENLDNKNLNEQDKLVNINFDDVLEHDYIKYNIKFRTLSKYLYSPSLKNMYKFKLIENLKSNYEKYLEKYEVFLRNYNLTKNINCLEQANKCYQKYEKNLEKYENANNEDVKFEKFNLLDDIIQNSFAIYCAGRFRDSLGVSENFLTTCDFLEGSYMDGMFNKFDHILFKYEGEEPMDVYKKNYMDKENENLLREYIRYSDKDPNFKVIKKFDSNVMFNIGDKFRVSEKVMLDCLDRALRKDKIGKECINFMRCMFKRYLILGYIKLYGNQEDKNNVLLLRLSEYFDNILNVFIEEDEYDGKYKLRLNFKEAYKDKYFTQKIISDIERFKDAENWDFNLTSDQMVYRVCQIATAFVKKYNFWNRYLAYLICNKQVNVAENFSSNNIMGLYDEYKGLNEEMLNYKQDSNHENYFDRMFLNFITGKKYNKMFKNCIDGYSVDDVVAKDCFCLRDEKKMLSDVFISNLNNFVNPLNENFVEWFKKYNKNVVKYFNPALYPVVLGYCNSETGLKELFESLGEAILKYDLQKGKADEDKYYKLVLDNEEIANKFINFVESFFYYYMNVLVKENNDFDLNSNYDFDLNSDYVYNEEQLKLKLDIDSIINWFSKIFYPHVENGKIKFDLKIGYCDDETGPNVEKLVRGIVRNNNQKHKIGSKNNLLKNLKSLLACKSDIYELNANVSETQLVDEILNTKTVETFLWKLFYNITLDVFAFLNSEEFWNDFFINVVYKKLNNVSKKLDFSLFDKNISSRRLNDEYRNIFSKINLDDFKNDYKKFESKKKLEKSNSESGVSNLNFNIFESKEDEMLKEDINRIKNIFMNEKTGKK